MYCTSSILCHWTKKYFCSQCCEAGAALLDWSRGKRGGSIPSADPSFIFKEKKSISAKNVFLKTLTRFLFPVNGYLVSIPNNLKKLPVVLSLLFSIGRKLFSTFNYFCLFKFNYLYNHNCVTAVAFPAWNNGSQHYAFYDIFFQLKRFKFTLSFSFNCKHSSGIWWFKKEFTHNCFGYNGTSFSVVK